MQYLFRMFLNNAQQMIEGFRRMLSGSEDCLSLNVYTQQVIIILRSKGDVRETIRISVEYTTFRAVLP